MVRTLALLITLTLAVWVLPAAMAQEGGCAEPDCPSEPPAGEPGNEPPGEEPGDEGTPPADEGNPEGNSTEPSDNETNPVGDAWADANQSTRAQMNGTSQNGTLAGGILYRTCPLVSQSSTGWRVDPENCIQRMADRILGPPVSRILRLIP